MTFESILEKMRNRKCSENVRKYKEELKLLRV